MVFNLALHYVQNVEDAEEITQDVFVKIFNGLHTFKNQSSIKTWIYRITINQSLDFISSRNTKKRLFLTSFLGISLEKTRSEAINFNHPGVEHQLENERISSLRRSFSLLPRAGRLGVLLCGWHVITYSDQATADRFSVGSSRPSSLASHSPKCGQAARTVASVVL